MTARILIVDDNEVVRGLIGEALRAMKDGKCARRSKWRAGSGEKREESDPNLIILDLAMPVMDGRGATREITKILPSVPIVIYTLHYAEWVVLEAKKAGARAVVSKSDATRLVSVAEDLLQKQSVVAVAGATRLMCQRVELVSTASLRPIPGKLTPSSNLTDPLLKSVNVRNLILHKDPRGEKAPMGTSAFPGLRNTLELRKRFQGAEFSPRNFQADYEEAAC